MKHEGYIREGEFLFVSTKSNDTFVLDNGAIKDGRPNPINPIYVDFAPGPFGGAFRTKDPKLAAALRDHPQFGKNTREIKTYDELIAFAAANEHKRNTLDDRVVNKSMPILKRNEPEAPAAVKSPVPVAAVGPRR